MKSWRWRAALLLLFAAAGCGSDALWARYRAERSFWRARRIVERIQIDPALATEAGDVGRAITAFRDLAAAYPASRWATAERMRDAIAQDVAVLSGDAVIAVGQLEELRGDREAALREYQRAAQEYRAVTLVALRAALAKASVQERGGQIAEAIESHAVIARTFPLVDPKDGEALIPVMDAPLRVAAARREVGDRAGADSILRATEARFRSEIARIHEARKSATGTPRPAGKTSRDPSGRAAAELWLRIAQIQAASGRIETLDPALDALRRGLGEPGAEVQAPRLILSLAELSLAGGRPDSALVYARWGTRLSDQDARAQAGLFEARIWEQRGVVDSAAALYSRLAERLPAGHEGASQARFRRGLVLEQAGRWELARSELRALAVSNPTHVVAFASLERIVTHHAERGERELAEVESRRALEQLDRMISTYRDPEVLLRAHWTRARILLAVEKYDAAFAALNDLWTRYAGSPVGGEAGWLAAEVAETRLNDRGRALQLYRELAGRAADPRLKAAARGRVARLEGAGG